MDYLASAEFNGDIYFSFFTTEIPFLGKFGPKNQNYQFKLKFGNSTNSNMQNSIMVFTFSIFDLNNLFWANVIQKIKMVSLS